MAGRGSAFEEEVKLLQQSIDELDVLCGTREKPAKISCIEWAFGLKGNKIAKQGVIFWFFFAA